MGRVDSTRNICRKGVGGQPVKGIEVGEAGQRLRLKLHSKACRGRWSSRPRKLRLWDPQNCSTEVKDTQEKVTILQIYFPQSKAESWLISWPLPVTSEQESTKTTA